LLAEQGYCCGFQNENWINRVLRGIERFGMVGLYQLAEPHRGAYCAKGQFGWA